MERSHQDSTHRAIIADVVDRDPVGKRLTPDARERAIQFALDTWGPRQGNGEAGRNGIQHVLGDVLRPAQS